MPAWTSYELMTEIITQMAPEIDIPDLVSSVTTGDISWDDCQCGQLTVTERGRWPSNNFPEHSIGTIPDSCGTPWLVVEFIVALIQCVPTLDESGNPPSSSELSASALEVSDNATIVRSSLYDILKNAEDNNRIAEFFINETDFVGPNGGCGGSSTRFLVGFVTGC